MNDALLKLNHMSCGDEAKRRQEMCVRMGFPNTRRWILLIILLMFLPSAICVEIALLSPIDNKISIFLLLVR